jgi:aldose 1-epimerase
MAAAAALGIATGCAMLKDAGSTVLDTASKLSVPETYGKLPDGRTAKIFTLTNSKGLKARVTEYGAILVGLEAPDRTGKIADLTHGYDTLAGWLTNTSYFGSTVGRYANRIANGKFTLDGQAYTLATNNDPGGIPCHLHGGKVGFDKVLWTGIPVVVEGAPGVAFTYTSKDGEEGYPGTLKVTVTYVLTEANELKILFKAVTDKATVINLCHHSYWNLTGDHTQTILGHQLTLNATKYLPTTAGLIPTGELAPVAGTPMDFTTPHTIGERINQEFAALKLGGGYDHCWVVDGQPGQIRLAADAYDPASGRGMKVFSDQAGVQFYSGNFLDGKAVGKGGTAYQFRTAFCLETERFPDSPNQPTFATAVLRPGEVYSHTMVHQFYCK